jgi:hypothetical protein
MPFVVVARIVVDLIMDGTSKQPAIVTYLWFYPQAAIGQASQTEMVTTSSSPSQRCVRQPKHSLGI